MRGLRIKRAYEKRKVALRFICTIFGVDYVPQIGRLAESLFDVGRERGVAGRQYIANDVL